MKNEKIENTLKKPTAFSRIYKVFIYNLIPFILYNIIFWGYFSIDSAVIALDNITMLIIRPFEILTVFLFYSAIKYSFKFLNVLINIKKMLDHDNEIIGYGYAQMHEGVQGVGKTLNLGNNVLYTACEKNRSMRLRYFLQYPFKSLLQADVDFKVLEDTYNYFTNNSVNLPHLMTNFPYEYKGKINYPFSMKYIDQQKRLAESFALGITEFANDFSNTMRTVAPDKEDPNNTQLKNETFSLARQWLDLTIIADEQRAGESYLGYRSVVSTNHYLIAREKILRPNILELILNILESRVLNKKTKTTKRLSRFYGFIANICEDIGFYRFYYYDKETIKDRLKEKEIKTFILSCDIPFNYDNRGKRFDYSLYDKSPDDMKEIRQYILKK